MSNCFHCGLVSFFVLTILLIFLKDLSVIAFEVCFVCFKNKDTSYKIPNFQKSIEKIKTKELHLVVQLSFANQGINFRIGVSHEHFENPPTSPCLWKKDGKCWKYSSYRPLFTVYVNALLKGIFYFKKCSPTIIELRKREGFSSDIHCSSQRRVCHPVLHGLCVRL